MRFAASLLPAALKGGYSHRTLIYFHTATLVEYISRAESLDSGSAVVFLSTFLEPLGLEGSVPKDAIVSDHALLVDPVLKRDSCRVLSCSLFWRKHPASLAVRPRGLLRPLRDLFVTESSPRR